MSDFERHLTPSLSGKLWLLAALFTVLLPHLIRMPLPLTLACSGVFAWRLAHELKGWPLPRRLVRIVITFIAFVMVAALFKTVAGRDAGVALLTMMLCLKLLELHTLRDALITLYLGYFLVIGAFLFSQSIYTGAYLLVVVLLLTAALIALNHPRASRENTRYYLRYSGRLLLQAFPIMVVMFLLFPRLDAPLWSMPLGTSGKTGLSDQIRMGTISSLVESEEVAFRVEFKGAIPSADQLYWRGPVLWNTDGRLWQRRHQIPLAHVPLFEESSSLVEYTVTLEPNGYRWLFTLDLPHSLPQGQDAEARILPDFQVVAERPITSKQRYTAQSALINRGGELNARHRSAALRLPDGTNPRTIALAQQWVDEGLAADEIVERALTYFRHNDFYYTRKPPLLQTNPVDDFLFNTRRGFCEHYATSFVTLMRAAGIPARVVTGYQGGESNKLGDYLIVRQSNAHAWAEVWLEQSGWTRIDPTTSVPQERVEEEIDTQRFTTTDLLGGITQGKQFNLFTRSFLQLRQVWDSINHGWNQWVLGFDKEQQAKLLKRLGMKDNSMQNLLLTMVVIVLLIVAAITAAVLLKRPRQKDPLQRYYQRFCDSLARHGTVRKSNEGPMDFARRACEEQPALCEQINRVTLLYIALRYQPQCEQTSLAEFKRAVQI